jgi:hypothetical protein
MSVPSEELVAVGSLVKVVNTAPYGITRLGIVRGYAQVWAPLSETERFTYEVDFGDGWSSRLTSDESATKIHSVGRPSSGLEPQDVIRVDADRGTVQFPVISRCPACGGIEGIAVLIAGTLEPIADKPLGYAVALADHVWMLGRQHQEALNRRAMLPLSSLNWPTQCRCVCAHIHQQTRTTDDGTAEMVACQDCTAEWTGRLFGEGS